ncbi:MAG: hypothetical protein KAJ03_10845 [Gammaproteobacteria bacterium]|nr:hypothetical protein [Gammaproteobacteria bacterium]
MKAIRIIGVLLVLIMLSGIVSAAYTTYAHPAFKIRDGRDSNLVGTTLGNGFLIDVTCTSNCTGFGSGTNTTDEDIRNVTSDFLVAGAGINLSRDDANDTLTITNTAIGGVSNFYLYNNSVMNTTLNTNGELSTTVSYGVDDYLLKTWESPAVNITSTGEGIAQVHIHLSETAASKGSQVYAKWFKNVSGVETLIATSGLSGVIGTSSIAYEINKAVEIQPVNTSDTFIIRLYGNITGSGGNASITISTEGTTFSRFELPVPVVTGVAGATGADGTDGESFSINVSGETALTNNATLVAGTDITLSQTDNNITINSIGGSSSKTNLLAGLTPSFVDWATNPGNNSQIVHEMNTSLTTQGVKAATAEIPTIYYDLGDTKRVTVSVSAQDTVTSRGVVISFSDDNSTWHIQSSFVTTDSVPLQATAHGSTRYIRYEYDIGSAGANTFTFVSMRAYLI